MGTIIGTIAMIQVFSRFSVIELSGGNDNNPLIFSDVLVSVIMMHSAPGLLCSNGMAMTTIPGCKGNGADDWWDYCYDPNIGIPLPSNVQNLPTIANSLFDGNTALIYGGGISFKALTSVDIYNSTFVNHHAIDGAGIYIQNGAKEVRLSSSTF